MKRGRNAIENWETGQKYRKKHSHRQRLLKRYSPNLSPNQQRSLSHRIRGAIYCQQVTSMATYAGKHDHHLHFDTDSAPLGIDNRCTGCISGYIQDFEGPLKPSGRTIKGFMGTTTSNVMVGTIKWKWDDDEGKTHTFKIPHSFYVKGCGVRLLSPQHWAQAMNDKKPRAGTGSETTHQHCTLFWQQRRYKRTVPLDRNSNVATLYLAPGYARFHAFCSEAGIDNDEILDPIVEEARSTARDEIDEATISRYSSLTDHLKTAPKAIRHPGSMPLDGPSTRTHTEPPVTLEEEEEEPSTNVAAEFLKYHLKFNHCPASKIRLMAKQGLLPARLATCDPPLCSSCQFGKASRKPWRQKTATNSEPAAQARRPGEIVSVDQLISRTPGLIAQIGGFLTKERYTCATVFVDQYSNLGYVHLQRTTSAQHTIEAKKAFERFAAQHGVTILQYHADNGTFAANEWVQACHQNSQRVTFAGVNAHHQNRKAEVRIRHLQDMARTMMIHANKRWPEAVSTHLWPYAIRMANDSINSTPWVKDPDHFTPMQRFASTTVQENPKHWHHFGCPVYVLDENLQQGRRPPGGKWKERARIGLYLGRSPQHSRNIALVLNLQTGRVSPQFHTKIDSLFYSVRNATAQERTTSKWQEAAGFIKGKGPGSKTDKAANTAPRQEVADLPPTTPLIPAAPHRTQRQAPEGGTPSRAPTRGPEGATAGPNIQTTAQPRRSERLRKAPTRLIEAMAATIAGQEIPYELFSAEALFPLQHDGDPIIIFKASVDPDTMYMHQAMKEPDAPQFKKAMLDEITAQINGGVLTLVHISDVPKGASILPAVWQMKRKRDIKTRQVYKWKARLNLDGSRMVYKRDYDQTYAPVASWNSIRLLLILVAIHGWHTVQLDYVLAFTQAPAERDLYMKIPKGFEIEGAKDGEYVFKVTKNTYGKKQAGRVWNQYLVQKLTKVGWKQSAVDECVFYKGKMIYVLYTDDSIIAGPDKEEIRTTIEAMKQVLNLTVEGNLNDFLGVNLERKENGEIHLIQPHLIEQITKDLRLKAGEAKTRDIPMKSSTILTKHQNSPGFDNSFNYRSVLGKLNYLEKGSRPDIAYAVHQCARYSVDPRKEHGDAVRWLGRYLLGTSTKGMILKPDLSRSFEVFVDADFCGNWDKSISHESDIVRSRHGYCIMYAGCPITWKSQLQTEITLSTTESEYTGLSYALREAIPIMELLKEMKQQGIDVLNHRPTVHCEVFEDNSGALEIATVHKWRPRTKHLATKLHHFRSYVQAGDITIRKIDTSDQPADVLTKPLPKDLFEKHRKTIMGW